MACNTMTGYNWTVELTDTATTPVVLWDGVEVSEITISWDSDTIEKQALADLVSCVKVTKVSFTIDVAKFVATDYPLMPTVGQECLITISDSQTVPVVVYEGPVISTSGSLGAVTVNDWVVENASFVSNGAPTTLAGAAWTAPV